MIGLVWKDVFVVLLHCGLPILSSALLFHGEG